MEKSLYPQYVEKYFPQYVVSVVERLNGRSLNNQIPFLFIQLLTPQYSADGRFATILAKYESLAADVVALGSPLPLKSRDSMQTYVGEIPKIGVKRTLDEQQMKNIDNMIAQGRPEGDIANAIFSDIPFVINAVDERIEDLFLSMFSTGLGVTTNNVGTGVRLDMHYLTENQFGVSTVWSDPDATPVNDITKVFDKAENDGNVIRHFFADNTLLGYLYANTQMRGLFGFQQNYVGGGSNVPLLAFEQLADLFMRRWSIELHRVVRSTRTEINGQRTNHKAWKDGMGVFACDDRVGDLVYTSTAEETRPVPNVTYQMANPYTLVSKYGDNDPIIEYTASQAMVVPVVNNADRIYTIDSKTVQA